MLAFMILLISAIRVAGNTGVSHCAQLLVSILTYMK
jgi:hypothetical protein